MFLSSGRRRLGCAFAALGVAVATAGLFPTPASAASVGYVRLAHLSPDTPAVDVYLTSQSGSVKQKFDAVAYGVMSEYLALPVGGYSVAMRQEGAAETTDPVITEDVTVAEGGAYTVAGVGRFAGLGLKVFSDDLSLPADGKSKVRIIQASVRAPVLDVAAADGETFADDIAFATTTDYSEVAPGRLTLELTGGGNTSTTSASVRTGNVYSLLVLDTASGNLKTELRTDARRDGSVPFGGVDTGAGGTAPRPFARTPWLIAAGALLLIAIGLVSVRRERQHR